MTNRLTARAEDGSSYYPKCFEEPCSGMGCNNPKCKMNYEYCEKLAHYEDLEEQGRLIELPCIVGDTLYLVTKDTVEKMKVYCISPYGEYCCKDHVWNFVIENRKYSLTCEFKDIGKIVFKTREEAESKLKEMEKNNAE